MKKALKVILALGIIGVIAYKVYEYFVKDQDEDVIEGDIVDELEEDFEEEEEESLAEKIRAAVKKAVD